MPITVLRVRLLATSTLLAVSVLLQQTSFKRVEGRIVCVPEVQKLPTLDKPFIYIHQRKSGGTSVRRAIVNAAVDLKLNDTIFVPCFQQVQQAFHLPWQLVPDCCNSPGFLVCLYTEGYCLQVHCETFQPDPRRANRSVSIYAGHFNWYTVVPEDHAFACLTTFRHPVDRVVSCLYITGFPSAHAIFHLPAWAQTLSEVYC